MERVVCDDRPLWLGLGSKSCYVAVYSLLPYVVVLAVFYYMVHSVWGYNNNKAHIILLLDKAMQPLSLCTYSNTYLGLCCMPISYCIKQETWRMIILC